MNWMIPLAVYAIPGALYVGVTALVAIATMLFVRDVRPIVWPLFAAVKYTLAFVGLVTCLLGAMPREWPRLLWLWGDDEYHAHRAWWHARNFPKSPYWKRYWWHAIRNPIANVKYLINEPGGTAQKGTAVPELEAQPLQQANRKRGWRYRSAGVLSSIKAIWLRSDSYIELYFGFKIGSPVPGVGFTTQLRKDKMRWLKKQ